MNIINAICNLVNNPITNVVSHYSGKNRANNTGDALEEYVKDLFAQTLGMQENDRLEQLSQVFSYLGNNSNPPDAMLRGGDAIEIKKIESNNSALALNSSYPKHKLSSNSELLSKACKNAEEWVEKDIIYVVGVVKDKVLRHFSMVYGLDYCATEECYNRIRSTIKDGVESIPGVNFSKSRELGHINRVDPLGITYLRVRGMWGIENPWKAFDYVYKRDLSKAFTFMCIINEEKWNSFDNTRLLDEITKPEFQISDIRIKDPDNPAKLKTAKLVTFYKN